MRPLNSPTSKSTNIYKSSTMLKKVGPQQTIMSNRMLQSKKQLNSARSQELLRSTSQHQEYQPDLKRVNSSSLRTGNDNFAQLKSSERIRLEKTDRDMASKLEQKAHTYDNGDQYIGQWIFDNAQLKQKPHGYGVYKFKRQGLQYRGYFKSGLMHGTGTLHRLNEERLKGKPFTIYQGQWMNGEKNGTGKYYYDLNYYYQGNWNRNHKEGKGRFISPQGEYNGLWLNDKKHGKGLLKLTNGTIYDGQWQNDELVSGQIKYSNGDVYRGQSNQFFQRHLQGEYSSREQTYKGTWRRDKKEGQGEIQYNSGQSYKGQMRNDVRQGENCIYTWNNGAKVICTFENNFPVRGRLIQADNNSFEFDRDRAIKR